MSATRGTPLRALFLLYVIGCAGEPSVFRPRGEPAGAISTLGLWVTGVMVAVVVVTCLLYVLGAARSYPETEDAMELAERERRGVRWVVVGGAIVPALILVVLFGFTLFSMRAVSKPEATPAWTIHVTGNQWWWKAEYRRTDSPTGFITANEIHVPVDEAVAVELESADVIHSFWVPQLAGKTDLIPGRTNRLWLVANRPGIYHGQCAEFCGVSHARMGIRVVAESPTGFDAWVRRQRRVPEPDSLGLEAFGRSGCAACHRIAGTFAQGSSGPDLTHIGSRATLAAGMLENDPESMADWLRAPDSIKAGSRMPDLELDDREIATLVQFLQGLQ